VTARYLLDTDIVSETVKPRPSPGLMTWLTVVTVNAWYARDAVVPWINPVA
jgi:predicted nucleic acid-binding protein